MGGAGQNFDFNRVNAELGQVQTHQRHVRGGKAQIAAALVAADDLAVDPVQVTQHGCSLLRTPFGQCFADRGGADFAHVELHQGRNGHAESEFISKGLQVFGCACAALAEMEIRPPHDNMAQT